MEPDQPGEPLTTLRGAGAAAVDGAAVRRAIVAICLAGLCALVILFYIAGARKNAEITDLHSHGRAVEVSLSDCVGLMGGSGSNLVGYSCRGDYTFGGRRYRTSISSNTPDPPPAAVRAIADPDEPGLVATVPVLAAEHASVRVFVLPTVLLAVLVLALGAVLHRRRMPG